MARPAAIAVGGYVATPADLLPRIATLVSCGAGHHAFVDPCAGEGEAVLSLARLMAPSVEEESSHKPGTKVVVHRAHVFAAEMEATRHATLKRGARHTDRIAHGDAFRLQLGDEPFASVVYLNSPFAPDRRFGRLEEKWLQRFGPTLRIGGALLFVLPFYALEASAETLAREYDVCACYRFDPWPDLYKRVLVVARRRSALLAPDPATVARVMSWSSSPEPLPFLPPVGSTALFEVAGEERFSAPYSAWTMEALDERSLRSAHTPWHQTDRAGRLQAVPNIVPAESFETLLAPRFPVATVPRPAHLAAGLASGLLSGARLRPTDPASRLPEILVRGTFRRRFVLVEEKFNRDGDKMGEVQAQVPELEIVALDLSAGTYHTLKSSTEQTGARRVSDMTAGDLLASYGRDLLSTLRDRCPALYDPVRPEHMTMLPEAEGARPLFTAQGHAVRAVARLLSEGDQTAILLGEIGTGKTTVSLRAAQTIGARRIVAMTPPHVVEGFAAQVPEIWPGAKVARLESVADVDAFMASDDPSPIVALMSREDAKLGHPWAGVGTGLCPRCGTAVRGAPEDLAKERARCGVRRWSPTGPAGFVAARLALAIHQAAPGCINAQAFVPGRVARKMRLQARANNGETWPLARQSLRDVVPAVVRLVGKYRAAWMALAWLLWAIDDPALTLDVARDLYVGSSFNSRAYGDGHDLREVARALLLTVGDAREPLVAELRKWPVDRDGYYGSPNPWTIFDDQVGKLAKGEKVWIRDWKLEGRKVEHRDGSSAELGSVQAAVHALAALVSTGEQRQSEPCGEPLFQAIPEPRRYPLAHYLAKRYRRQLRAGDFALVIDEAHEYAGAATAQAFASQQLLGLRIPTICMTGSVMNGYAESLFNLLWWTSAAFRAEFDRRDRQDFVRTYGYVKQLVQQRDGEGQRVVFGAHTDRVETVARESGQAPGVLPTLLLRYLLPRAVTLQMSDIEGELPGVREIPTFVAAEGTLLENYRTLQRKLIDQMKRDRFDAGLAGKLFGQLAELPASLDRMTSDVTGDAYTIRYPESAGVSAGRTVVEVDALPADARTPKEAALLDILRRELDEGRNAIVFVWHLDLMPRLAKLAAEVGRVAVLDCGKVPPSKRDAWIAKEITKKARILLVNPVGVSTGINSMVPYFSTVIWYENPACNPQIRRQANGRVRRIGQVEEARFYSLVYSASAQEIAHQLLTHKVAIGEAADGLDATAALQAAGVGTTDAMVAQDLGRALFEALTSESRPLRLAA